MAQEDITTPPPAWEAHPLYVVRAAGVGGFAVGAVVLAGDLGSADNIQALEAAGQIAPYHTPEAQNTFRGVVTEAPAPQGETDSSDVSTNQSRTAKRTPTEQTPSTTSTPSVPQSSSGPASNTPPPTR